MELIQYILVEKKFRDYPQELLLETVRLYHKWYTERIQLSNEHAEWYSQEQKKIVLQVESSKLKTIIENETLHGVFIESLYGNIFLCDPKSKEDMMPIVKKFQTLNKPVSNSTNHSSEVDGELIFNINSELNMTLGKTIAQLGHVCTQYFQGSNEYNEKNGVSIVYSSQLTLEQQVQDGCIYIKDNGHTEIKPDSLTVTLNQKRT